LHSTETWFFQLPLPPIGTQSTIANKQTQSQSTADAKNCKCIPHEFCINDKVLICHDIGNPYLGKLAKPTQGPFKIIDVQQLPINGTVLIQ
jgi:hypothetical protein